MLKNLGLPSNYLMWSGGWRQCNSAKNLSKTSSCRMVDLMIEKLIQYNPNLEKVVVIGHSAGAQFVNRYVQASAIDEYADDFGVEISYGASAPGNYAFPSSWRPTSHYPSTHSLSPQRCNGFDKWKYGLTSRNSYSNDYTTLINRHRAMTREVYYFVGDEDTDTSSNCKDKVQGSTRIARMWNYRDALNRSCSSVWCKYYFFNTANAYKELSGIGHNSKKLLATSHARNIMFYW